MRKRCQRCHSALAVFTSCWYLLTPPAGDTSAQTQSGIYLTPLDPALVEDSLRSANSTVAATIRFVNQSGRAVDIYWINFQGERVLYKSVLPAEATFTQPTYLKHLWLVVQSGSGGATARDTGTRLAGFEAQTPNPTLNPAIHDTAIILRPPGNETSAAPPNPPAGEPGSPASDGAYKIGNGVSAPQVVSKRSAEFSEVARKLRVDNVRVLLSFVVLADGTAANFQVTRSVGYGLDEKAVDSFRQARFTPGMKEGKPVPTRVQAEIAFPVGPERASKTWYSGAMDFYVNPTVALPVVKDGSMPKPGSDSLPDQTVVLEFTVNATGAVKNIHALSGSPEAAELLQRYLLGWKFRPAVADGNAVEATGRVEFVKGNKNAESSAPAPVAPPSPADRSPQGVPADILLGEYRREPVVNKWHQGVITWDMPKRIKLRWTNEAGLSWALTPDLKNGILRTDPQDNPYYNKDPQKGRNFRLRLRPGGASVEGFEFNGEFYAKVDAPPAAKQETKCLAPPAGMVAWWPGDNHANDIVGGHNPIGINAVSLAPGQVRRGFKFGFEGYLEIPKSPDLENQQFTWLAWVKPDGPGPNASAIIVNQNIDGGHAAICLAWRPADQRFTFHSGNHRDELLASKNAFPAGDFYLVAATYDGKVFRLYVNGVLEGALSQAKTVAYSNYGWEIGAGALRFFPKSADTFNGVIDEVQAYNRALSQSELLSIFAAAGDGVCRPEVSLTDDNRQSILGSLSGLASEAAISVESADIPPQLLSKVEPHYSEEARKAKYSGSVLLRFEIDTQGRPMNPQVLRPLGLGLDEEAIKALMQWRFQPAQKNGKPVAVKAQAEIFFRLL